MDTTTLLAGSGVALSICGIIYSAINHRHIRLRLCNRIYDFSIDVGTTNEEEENKKKEDEEKKKKEEEENKKKISYTPHVFKIQPLHF